MILEMLAVWCTQLIGNTDHASRLTSQNDSSPVDASSVCTSVLRADRKASWTGCTCARWEAAANGLDAGQEAGRMGTMTCSSSRGCLAKRTPLTTFRMSVRALGVSSILPAKNRHAHAITWTPTAHPSSVSRCAKDLQGVGSHCDAWDVHRKLGNCEGLTKQSFCLIELQA